MIIFLLQLLLLIPVGSFHSMGAGKGISHVAMIKISRSARLPSFANSNSDADILSTREAIKSTLTNTAQSIIAASAVVFTSYLKPALALPLRSDEFNVEIKTEFLGLSLAEIKVDDATLVTVQSIRDDADPLLKESIRPGMIIIAIGENPVEGYSGKEVVNLFKSISKPTQLTFRDPTLFFDNLNTTKALGIAAGLSAGSVTVGVRGGGVVDTMINFATNETLRVQRLNPEELTGSSRSANVGDVVEVEYSIRAMGRKDEAKVGSVLIGTNGLYSLNEDKSLYLVLGRPTDSLPSGFDLGLRGVSVGERRRVLLPPSLAYDTTKKFPLESGQTATVVKGQPLVIEVKLLSLNGLTTP